jgi:hypothetical protein
MRKAKSQKPKKEGFYWVTNPNAEAPTIVEVYASIGGLYVYNPRGVMDVPIDGYNRHAKWGARINEPSDSPDELREILERLAKRLEGEDMPEGLSLTDLAEVIEQGIALAEGKE